LLVSIAGSAVAQQPNENYAQQQGNVTQNYGSQQAYAPSQPSMQGGNMGFGSGFDIGMPEWSSAGPEYVAQQKMIENMTTAYNWVALNTARFADGCKTNKEGLVSEITSVIQQAQEASKACQRFATEASNCNPELFCSRFSNGSLPLPPEARIAMKKAGYNPDTIKIDDISEEMIIKMCLSMNDTEINSRKQMIESAKEQVRQQLASFRQKCEQRKQQMGGQQIRLPDFNPFQGGPNVVANQQDPRGPQGGCQSQPPDCYPRPPPFCQNGNWVCPEGTQQQESNVVCPGQAPSCAPAGAPMCQNGNWICPGEPQQQQPMQPQMPVPQEPAPQLPVPEQPAPTMPTPEQPAPQIQEPAPAPAPEPAPTPPATEGQTAPQFSFIRTITGLITGTNGSAICGNGICEPDFGESAQNCHDDCLPAADGVQGRRPTEYNPQQPMTQATGGQGMRQQGGQGMPGLSPEMLCNMTDEEIVESYTSQMQTGMPQEEEMEYRCKMESGRMLSEMSRYKLEIAKCKADAALDCQAKQQALQNCNEMKDSPEKIANLIVNNMCRRFGTTTMEAAKNKLYAVANKWYESDPALANQLGDTADKTIEDQKALGVLSYFFGNGEYASKLEERAQKLKEVRDRLKSNGVTDTETLATVEAQINEMETESGKFKNFFDVTRIGYIFRQQ